MGPEQYEKFVADYFKNLGYETTITPQRNDYGVDVFAESETEKVAVQAKNYGRGRQVNRQMIMELYGAKKYFDCQRAVMATNGRVIENARQVAEKLNVEILELDIEDSIVAFESTSDGFDNIWCNHIAMLEGKTIKRTRGGENKILAVDSSGLTRLTSNGRKQKIDIEIFRQTVSHLIHYGSLTRDEVNQLYAKRASSGVVLILSQLEMFELSNTRPMKLIYKKSSS